MLRLVTIVAAACLLSACATTYSLNPSASLTQDVRYDRGSPVVLSRKERGAVRVAPASSEFEGRMALAVVAFNEGDTPANIGFENVSVTTGSGRPVRTYSFEQLTREARTAAAWQAFAVALGSAANAYAASQPATVNTYGSVYGSGGYATYTGHTTIYNPSATAAANQLNQIQTANNLDRIASTLEATLAGLDGSVLRTTTIDPGQAAGGTVIADKPKFGKGEQQDVRVMVTFNGEEHEFSFSVRRN